MGTRLFVGNLAYETRDTDLRELFTRVGACRSAAVMLDRATAKSRGFGFVEMDSEDAARRAISELNGAQLQGRNITVSEARDRSEPRPPRTFGSGPRFSTQSLPDDPPPRRGGKSRRGLRGRKRSL